jgi:hypothetical protein
VEKVRPQSRSLRHLPQMSCKQVVYWTSRPGQRGERGRRWTLFVLHRGSDHKEIQMRDGQMCGKGCELVTPAGRVAIAIKNQGATVCVIDDAV